MGYTDKMDLKLYYTNTILLKTQHTYECAVAAGRVSQFSLIVVQENRINRTTKKNQRIQNLFNTKMWS